MFWDFTFQISRIAALVIFQCLTAHADRPESSSGVGRWRRWTRRKRWVEKVEKDVKVVHKMEKVEEIDKVGVGVGEQMSRIGGEG